MLNDEGQNYDGGSNAAVSILNVVNEEYTGVIYVNCSLAFYTSKKSIVDQRIYPTVMNLNTDFINHTTTASPWPLLSVNTNTMQNHTIKRSDLPLALRQSENMGKIYLDVHASGHECEEFYYTNLPTTNISSSLSSSCKGGPIRLLQVHIDGQLAGALVPFPTVYTGGICIYPMLWRPLTGIESFDMEHIDLT